MSAYRLGHTDATAVITISIITLCLCLTCSMSALAAKTGDVKSATEPGVAIQIVSNTADPIFPKDWTIAPVVVKATPLPPEQVDGSIYAVQQALAKYPATFLRKNLRTVFIAGSLTINNVDVGGTAWSAGKSIYLARDATTGSWLAACVHHEFAHILWENHHRNLSRERWQQQNLPGFQYANSGLEAIRTGNATKDLDDSLLQRGFVARFATSAFDEDIACTCEALWSGDQAFWQAVDRYEVLRHKVTMTIDFYHSLDAQFTEAYFRGIHGIAYFPYDPIPFPYGGYIYRPGSPDIPVPVGGTATYPPGGGYVQNPTPTVIK